MITTELDAWFDPQLVKPNEHGDEGDMSDEYERLRKLSDDALAALMLYAPGETVLIDGLRSALAAGVLCRS